MQGSEQSARNTNMEVWGSRLHFKVLDEMDSCGCKPWYTPLALSACCCCPCCWFFTRSYPCPGIAPVPKQCPLAMVSSAIIPIPVFSCFSCHTWMLELSVSGEGSWTKKSLALYNLTVCAPDLHVPCASGSIGNLWGLPTPHWSPSPCPRGQFLSYSLGQSWGPPGSQSLSEDNQSLFILCLAIHVNKQSSFRVHLC